MICHYDVLGFFALLPNTPPKKIKCSFKHHVVTMIDTSDKWDIVHVYLHKVSGESPG